MPPRPSGRATLDAHVDVIKQHPGPVTAQRRVKVDVPGKFFPQLEASERALNYEGEAVEFQERRDFKQHVAWGAAHKGPGIRFVCTSDAIDDPDNKGFWTTLALFNRWRHETYKDRRNDELQYLDAVPAQAIRLLPRRPPRRRRQRSSSTSCSRQITIHTCDMR